MAIVEGFCHVTVFVVTCCPPSVLELTLPGCVLAAGASAQGDAEEAGGGEEEDRAGAEGAGGGAQEAGGGEAAATTAAAAGGGDGAEETGRDAEATGQWHSFCDSWRRCCCLSSHKPMFECYSFYQCC